MTQLLIDRATLEQILTELQRMSNACELEGDKHRDGNKWHRLSDDAARALSAGRAALSNAEPTGFSLTNTSISDTSRTIESFFEAMDKEVAAGRLVRTGPMEWTKL